MKRILQIILIVLLAPWFIATVVVVGAVGGGVYAYLQYDKKASTEVEGKAELSTSASEIFDAYSADEASANTKFLSKIIEVSGTILEVGENTINLETGDPMGLLSCDFAEGTDLSSAVAGKSIKIVGACTGYTGFDVQLSKCKIVEQ